MKRRIVIGLVAGLVLAPSVVLAQSVADRIVTELQRQGFTDISSGTTLLGRGRVVASGPDGRREIIFNPRTGEILRDLWQVRRAGSGSTLLGSGGDASRDRGRSGRDDADDDRDDDQDDDDDDGGSGSSGSGGGGSGNSGSGGDDSDDDSDDS